MAKPPSRAEEFRKRASAISKTLTRRRSSERKPLMRKQKALNDMADNEDWLDGKVDPRK